MEQVIREKLIHYYPGEEEIDEFALHRYVKFHAVYPDLCISILEKIGIRNLEELYELKIIGNRDVYKMCGTAAIADLDRMQKSLEGVFRE